MSVRPKTGILDLNLVKFPYFELEYDLLYETLWNIADFWQNIDVGVASIKVRENLQYIFYK